MLVLLPLPPTTSSLHWDLLLPLHLPALDWRFKTQWKLMLPNVKERADGNLLYVSGNSNWGSGTTERGGMGRKRGGRFKREGAHIHLWLIHLDVWQKPTKFCKAIILQFKNKLNFKIHAKKIQPISFPLPLVPAARAMNLVSRNHASCPLGFLHCLFAADEP